MAVIEQDRIFETIEAVQGRVIETNQKLAETLNDGLSTATKLATEYTAPLRKRMPASLTDRVNNRLAAISIPDLPQVPRPNDAVDTYFNFVERATKTNRNFASQLVNIWAPATKTAPATEAPPTTEVPTAAAAPGAAKKPTTRKPAAKKAAARKPVAKTS